MIILERMSLGVLRSPLRECHAIIGAKRGPKHFSPRVPHSWAVPQMIGLYTALYSQKWYSCCSQPSQYSSGIVTRLLQ